MAELESTDIMFILQNTELCRTSREVTINISHSQQLTTFLVVKRSPRTWNVEKVKIDGSIEILGISSGAEVEGDGLRWSYNCGYRKFNSEPDLYLKLLRDSTLRSLQYISKRGNCEPAERIS